MMKKVTIKGILKFIHPDIYHILTFVAKPTLIVPRIQIKKCFKKLAENNSSQF